MRNKEDNLQAACVRWFRYEFKTSEAIIFAVPNGGARSIVEGKILKATGVLAGVADLIIMAPNRIAFIELKTEKGRQQPTQKEFQQICKEFGHPYYLCRSLQEFIVLSQTIVHGPNQTDPAPCQD